MPVFRRSLIAIALLALVACGQPADPLEWKVSAKTPNDYNRWSDATLPMLDESLRKEFNRAFNYIVVRTPRHQAEAVRHMDEEHNAICQRMHGRTIRAVILDGYALETEYLLSHISTEMQLMLRNVKSPGALAAKSEARFTEVREAQQARVDTMNRRLAEIETRVKQLSGTAAKK